MLLPVFVSSMSAFVLLLAESSGSEAQGLQHFSTLKAHKSNDPHYDGTLADTHAPEEVSGFFLSVTKY